MPATLATKAPRPTAAAAQPYSVSTSVTGSAATPAPARAAPGTVALPEGCHLRKVMGVVKAAAEAYELEWEIYDARLSHRGGNDRDTALFRATAEFNGVLRQAAKALHADTAAYNSWASIEQAYGPKAGDQLSVWFAENSDDVVPTLQRMVRRIEEQAARDAMLATVAPPQSAPAAGVDVTSNAISSDEADNGAEDQAAALRPRVC